MSHRACAPLLMLALCALGAHARAHGRIEIDLSGDGWTLWLDDAAPWADDPLHLPGIDVATLPARPPSGGWDVLVREGLAVSVPSTVETWTWDARGDHRGVSWWRRAFTLPAAAAGRRVVLSFQAVRLRAEVFLDGALVGYDAVGHTPFEIDVTERVAPERAHELAVRVTDPGGNFDWIDHTAHRWGDQPIPPSHGFGGITGPVRLLVTDPVRTTDVFVASTPAITDVDVSVTVRNDLRVPARRDLVLTILEDRTGRVVHERTWPDVALPPGQTVIARTLSVPDAAPWSLDDPRLHRCRVRLEPPQAPTGGVDPASVTGDETSVRFGFRWFAPEGVGEDARFVLNGRRVVLTSAISWGFWPVTGMVPDPELARRQVETARALGLTMLNHHRGLAAPGLLDDHDELGLLAHEEPGGWWCQGGDALAFAFAREKWLRMVRRDRNHPSLVILNMVNEATVAPDARARDDLRAAQALDPTRTITFTSAWADRYAPDGGLHARPGDPELHVEGWRDWHDATGPGVDRDRFYVSPERYRRGGGERAPIVFLGEEGAIGAPPRLDAIAARIAARDALGLPRGWDSTHWLARRDALAGWLARPGWTDAFADVDALTGALGDVAYDFHARAVGNARLGDVVDGYVINGWEGERFENHSGIVDVWRYPKGDPARLRPYLASPYLAVKVPTRVQHAALELRNGRRTSVRLDADVFVVDESGRDGPHELLVRWLGPHGDELARQERAVDLAGGEVFGELLARGIALEAEALPGRQSVVAALYAPGARVRGEPPLVMGEERLALVRWRDVPVPDGGARVEGGERLGKYLRVVLGADVPALAHAASGAVPTDVGPHGGVLTAGDLRPQPLGPLRWIALADVDPEPRALIPQLDGNTTRLVPPESGDHRFHVTGPGGLRLWIDEALVLDAWDDATEATRTSESVTLVADRPVALRLERREVGAGVIPAAPPPGAPPPGDIVLSWSTPSARAPGRALARELLERVARDGTTLLVLTHAERWARVLADEGGLQSRGTLPMGRHWMGGGLVGRAHPLLDGLIEDGGGALDFVFQELVHYGAVRDGLLLDDVESVVACVTSHVPRVGTALGIAAHGRGRIVLCTLDVVTALDTPRGPGDAARALFANLLAFAADPE